MSTSCGTNALELNAIRGHLDIIKSLMTIDIDFSRAFFNSAYYGHLDVVKYFVEKGADIHANAEEALRWSAREGHLDVVKYLTEQGADIHAHSEEALQWSAEHGYLSVVKYLIEKGANVHANSKCVLEICGRHGYLEIIKFLVDKNLHIDTVNAPKHNVQTNVFKFMMEKNAYIKTGLDSYEHFDIIKFIGPGAHFNSFKFIKSTAYERYDLIEYLIEHKTNVHYCFENVLTLSSTYGHIDIVKYLIEEKNCDIRKSTFYTKHLDVIEFLEQRQKARKKISFQ